jgi:hypothetical protein
MLVATLDIRLPELSMNKIVAWVMYIDDMHTPTEVQYDLILGLNIMTKIGIYLDTVEKELVWEGARILLKYQGT